MSFIHGKDEIFKLTCLFMLYFVQAMPYGFQSRYLPLVMRKNGASLTNLGLYKLLLIPWICKFLISAFVIDVYKSKRFWLLTSMLMLSCGSYLGAMFNDFSSLTIVLFCLNWASACQDICVDWFAINALKKEDLGIGNTIQVAAFKLGTLFSGGVLVYFMDYTTVSTNFFILGLIYSVCLLLLNSKLFKNEISVQTSEEDDGQDLSITDRFTMIHNSPATYWICTFVIIYKLGEQSSLNMMPIFLVDQKVSSETIGLWTGIIGQSFSIAGSILGGLVLKQTNKYSSTVNWLKYVVLIRVVPIFLITYFIYSFETYKSDTQKLDNSTLNILLILVLLQLFMSGILTTFTFTLMMEISFMAPKKIQATHFSLLATCEVLGKLLLQPVISAYTEYFGYASGFVMFSVLYAFCVIVFKLRPKHLLKNHPKSC